VFYLFFKFQSVFLTTASNVYSGERLCWKGNQRSSRSTCWQSHVTFVVVYMAVCLCIKIGDILVQFGGSS